MTTEQEWARGQRRGSPRVTVKFERVRRGFALGGSLRVVPMYPGGRVVAVRLGLGPWILNWGRVWR